MLPTNRSLSYLFLASLGLFLICAAVAIWMYPGGHRYDSSADGFSLLHNYWCELLRDKAWNGAENTSLHWSFATMISGALSSILFWIGIPSRYVSNRKHRSMIRIAGIIAMGMALLIMTPLHDEGILIGSGFGSIAIGLFLYHLYSLDSRRLFYTGIVVLVLLVFCNVLAFTNNYGPLPVMQKVSFLVVLIWMLDLSFTPISSN